MAIAGKKVAILVDNYFEQAEFEEPLQALKDAGLQVEVVGTRTKELQSMNHAERGEAFTADVLIDDVSSADYDALVLPGGAINSDQLRTNEMAQDWVNDFVDSDRPLAVICHAPWLLISAQAIKGRTLTSYHAIVDDILNAGGEWLDKPVVIDDNLITSRDPDDLPQFTAAIIDMLDTASVA